MKLFPILYFIIIAGYGLAELTILIHQAADIETDVGTNEG